MNKKPKGGKRPGAGRKAIADTKEPLTLYVLKTDIKEWGGKKVLRDRLHEYVASPANDRKITQKLDKGGKIPKSIQGPIIGSKEHLALVEVNMAQMQRKYAQPHPIVAESLPDAKRDAILAQIAEKEAEIKNPPKNPLIGLKMWLQSRYSDIAKLKAELKQLSNEQ